MRHESGLRPARGKGLLQGLALVLVVLWCGAVHGETRAVWATRTVLTSPESVNRLVEAAAKGGYNTIIAQVRGRGDAYYRSRHEPRAKLLKDQPAGFDPLAQLIARAHARGLKVHAWLNTYFIANVNQLPASPAHIVNAHPEWIMVPRDIAPPLARLNPRSKGYLEALVAHCRREMKNGQIEGLYASPAHPGYRQHLLRVWLDVLERYDVDGMHFDFVRYPNSDYDYSAAALSRFRATLGDLPAEERSRLDRAAKTDPLVWAERYPERWTAFRTAQITRTVELVYKAVKARKPKVLVTAAVFANDLDAESKRFQEWKVWLLKGILDGVCPMAYSQDTDTFRRHIAVAKAYSAGRLLWAGIGAWRIDLPSIAEKVAAARDLGADGFILFSYDSLAEREPSTPGEYLTRVRLAADELK